MNVKKIEDFVNRLGYAKVKKEIGYFLDGCPTIQEQIDTLSAIINGKPVCTYKVRVVAQTISNLKDVPLVYFER